jgi:hypothetical protein
MKKKEKTFMFRCKIYTYEQVNDLTNYAIKTGAIYFFETKKKTGKDLFRIVRKALKNKGLLSEGLNIALKKQKTK